MYINFKTEYNFLASYAKIDDIIKYAKDNKLDTIGICDVESTYGNIKFLTACSENNIKPIVGCEFFQAGQSYLLYAKNNEGLRRINELQTMRNKDGSFSFNEVEKDLILVIGRGSISVDVIQNQNIDKLAKLNTIFDDVYFGVYSNLNDAKNMRLIQTLENLSCKMLLIDEIRYLKDSDLNAYITLDAIKQNKKFKELKQNKVYYEKKKIKKYDNLKEYFNSNHMEFKSKIDVSLPEKKLKPPKYPFLKDGVSASEFLKSLCYKGLSKRLNNVAKENYYQRLEYELSVIHEMGFDDYFLIMWDIILYAKTNNIFVGPGRGSAAGSLVSYSLGITDLDPVASNLIFERFLNPERISMPDIDVDFEDVNRNEIVKYMIERFGSEHVVQIATFTKFQAKSAFRDVAKVWGIDNVIIDSIAKVLDPRISFRDNTISNRKIQSELIKNLELKMVLDIVSQIEQLPRQTSIHAAGVIISEDDITNYCSYSHDNVSEAEAKDLESLGLLKFDILSLAYLTFLHTIIEKINLSGDPLKLYDIKYNDPDVLKMIADGKTIGIFQLESQGMRQTLRQIQPNNLKEVANSLSLYRPGPREFIKDYVKNKKTFKVKHEIDEILKDSYGIIVYQEQIIQIACEMANYSLGKADILRRSIAKKDKETLDSLREDFIKSSVENDYDQKYAAATYDLIVKFCNYGFNKAHAYCYSMIAYQLSYLKYHYSDIFYEELFYYSYTTSNKRDEFLAELERQNVDLLPPSILKSDVEVSIENGNLRMGFLVIDGLGRDTAKQIIYNRQSLSEKPTLEQTVIQVFKDIAISDSQINKMVDAGCFDDFDYNHNTLKHSIINLVGSDAELIMTLMGDSYNIVIKEDSSFEELSTLEKKAIGINLKYKYFDKIKENYEHKINRPLYSVDKIISMQLPSSPYQTYYSLFKIKSFKEITTKTGKKMCFLTIESEQIYEMTVFNDVYETSREIIENKVGQFVVGLIKIENSQLYLKKI